MQGYMVGNGVTDGKFDGNALVPFAHGMSLISNNIFEVGEILFKERNKVCTIAICKVDRPC